MADMKQVVNLIADNKLYHTNTPDRTVASVLERIGMLTCIAMREDISTTLRRECVETLKREICSRNNHLGREKVDTFTKDIGVPFPKHDHSIYLMHHGLSKVWKIGRSVNPRQREKTLQHQDPRISLEWTIKAPGKFEQFLHKKFKKKRLRGEWFELTQEDVEWIKSKAFDQFIGN